MHTYYTAAVLLQVPLGCAGEKEVSTDNNFVPIINARYASDYSYVNQNSKADAQCCELLLALHCIVVQAKWCAGDTMHSMLLLLYSCKYVLLLYVVTLPLREHRNLSASRGPDLSIPP